MLAVFAVAREPWPFALPGAPHRGRVRFGCPTSESDPGVGSRIRNPTPTRVWIRTRRGARGRPRLDARHRSASPHRRADPPSRSRLGRATSTRAQLLCPQISPRATAAKAAIVSRASRPQPGPTPSHAPRSESRSPHAYGGAYMGPALIHVPFPPHASPAQQPQGFAAPQGPPIVEHVQSGGGPLIGKGAAAHCAA